MTCPNGHANPDHQQYCGECGAPLAAPVLPRGASPIPAFRPGPPRTSRRQLPRWLLIAAVSVAAVVVVAALTVWFTHRQASGDRWSAFPHTMGCSVDTSETPTAGEVLGYPPDMARANQATLEHTAEQSLTLTLQFRQPPDPAKLSYTVELTGARLSSGPFQGSEASIMIDSDPADELGVAMVRGGPLPVNWEAHRSDVSAANAKMDSDNDPGPRLSDPNLLTSADINGNVARLSLDISRQSDFLGEGPFRPSIRVIALPPIPLPGQPDVAPYQQYCHWDDAPDRSSSGGGDTPPSTSAGPKPSALPSPGPGGWGSPSPTGTVPAPDQGVWQFQSPTGNIVCHMGPTGAACEIRQHDYPVPAPPPNCAEYGDRFGIDHAGSASMACHVGSFFGQLLPTQAYDTPLTTGAITCVINEDAGVTCRDTTTGHFFRVSKQSYQTG